MWVNARGAVHAINDMMADIHPLPKKWLPVAIAPPGSNLEVCVIEKGVVYALIFPCRRNGADWIDAETKARLDVEPTHWCVWGDG